MLGSHLDKHGYVYIDDFGRKYIYTFAEYIGDAGGLKRAYPDPPTARFGQQLGLHTRYLRVRSVEKINGKRDYANIPVNVDNPLWTGELGQRLKVGNHECETIKKIEEKEYGRAGAAEERRQLKKFGINPYLPKQE